MSDVAVEAAPGGGSGELADTRPRLLQSCSRCRCSCRGLAAPAASPPGLMDNVPPTPASVGWGCRALLSLLCLRRKRDVRDVVGVPCPLAAVPAAAAVPGPPLGDGAAGGCRRGSNMVGAHRPVPNSSGGDAARCCWRCDATCATDCLLSCRLQAHSAVRSGLRTHSFPPHSSLTMPLTAPVLCLLRPAWTGSG